MTAWLVLALCAGPLIETLVCRHDAPAASDQTQVAATPSDPADAGQTAPGGLGEICQHGHCHHGGAFVAARGPILTADLSAGQVPYPAASAAPPSRSPEGLLRPPRA